MPFGSREKGICNSHPIGVETCQGASLFFVYVATASMADGLPGCGVVAAVGRDLRLREVASFRRGVVGLSHRGCHQKIREIRNIRQ